MFIYLIEYHIHLKMCRFIYYTIYLLIISENNSFYLYYKNVISIGNLLLAKIPKGRLKIIAIICLIVKPKKCTYLKLNFTKIMIIIYNFIVKT